MRITPHWPLDRTLAASMLLALASVASVLLVTWRNSAQLERTSALVVRTRDAIEAISDLVQSMTDVQAAPRGFAITGDARYLEPYETGRRASDSQLRRLEALMAEDTQQRARVAILKEQVSAELEWRAHLVRVGLTGDLDAARQLIASGEGRRSMNALRATATEIKAEEVRRLRERQAASFSADRRARMTLAVLAILVAVLVIGSYVVVRHHLIHRTRTELALREREEALRKSAAEVQDLYDRAPCGYHSLDAEGRFVAVNQTELDWLGYTRDELVGKRTPADIMTEDSRHVFIENFPRLRATGFVNDLEFDLVCKDGRVLPVLLSASSIRDAEGRFVASRSTIVDLTERRKAEREVRRLNEHLEALVKERTAELEVAVRDLQASVADHQATRGVLQEAEALYRTLFERSPAGVVLIDPATHRPVDFNSVAHEQLGYTRDEFARLTISDFETIEDLEATARRRDRVLRAGADEFETRHRTRTGEIRTVQVSIRTVQSGGKILLYCVFHDVTDIRSVTEQLRTLNAELEQRVRERTRQLEEANHELEAFSYSVSHDLRAPLRHIHGYIEMLKRGDDGRLSEKGRRYLDTIADASREMGTLIEDLLAFSRMGRSEMRWQKVDLDRIVRECLAGMATALDGRRIDWTIPALPCVSGDPAMLKQVFVNLLDNAVKYTRPREPARIEVGCAGVEDGRVVLFVRDNGVGFDPAYTNKLFGVFQRLHRADEFEGTGIGLASVRRIVSRHGGRTWAEGRPDAGAAVYFTLKPAGEDRLAGGSPA